MVRFETVNNQKHLNVADGSQINALRRAPECSICHAWDHPLCTEHAQYTEVWECLSGSLDVNPTRSRWTQEHLLHEQWTGSSRRRWFGETEMKWTFEESRGDGIVQQQWFLRDICGVNDL